jgi:hypothetical protein
MCKGACKGICKSKRPECQDKKTEYKLDDEKQKTEIDSTSGLSSPSDNSSITSDASEKQEIRSEEYPFEGSTEGC